MSRKSFTLIQSGKVVWVVFKKCPILSRITMFLLFPLLVACYVGYRHYFISPVAAESEVKLVSQSYSEVILRRDSFGVSHINGQDDLSVYYAMGYAHAEDRLWQLEVQRRLSRGELSEVFGPSTVQQDIWIRTLGLYESAKETLPYLSTEAIASLDAYAAGVNAYLQLGRPLPIEFSVLGITPEPWGRLDSLAWTKVFALNLSENFRSEIQRFVSRKYLTRNQLQTFFPEIETVAGHMEAYDGQEVGAALMNVNTLRDKFSIGGTNVGSNAWVVAGKYTQTGSPLLASDPHLGLQIPSLWYAVTQKGKHLDVSGMSLVGLPVVIFGRNEHISWGGTNMMADVQDVVFERVDPHNPDVYWHKGRWEKFVSRTEKIKVRSDFPSFLKRPIKPIEVQVRSTKNGPIISDAINGASQEMSLQWTALGEGDTTYEAFLKINRATNWKTFKESLSLLVAPALNVFYTDMEGNIGFQGAGKIPIRRKGFGILPLSSDDELSGWHGHIPFEDLPQSFNPEEGFIVNANNRNIGDDYPYFISFDFADSARAQRITQMLQAKIKSGKSVSVKDMVEIQMDVKDISTMDLVEVLASVVPQDKQQKKALDYLREWDGNADKDLVAPTIYYNWVRHLKREIFSDELTGVWNKQEDLAYLDSLHQKITATDLASLIRSETEWCDVQNTDERESCKKILAISLDKVVVELERIYGADVKGWRWGKSQVALYRHTPFSEQKIADVIFERTVENGGSANTVNVASGPFVESEGYQSVFGTGFRQITEMSKEMPRHLFINSTGQSGQVASQHYDDMMELFHKGRYVELHREKNGSPISRIYKIEGEAL